MWMIRERRTSMFRAALHVGFAPTGVLRLTRDQLDGACGDDRFDGDFFVDLIFEACSGSAQALETGVSNEEGGFSAAYDALLAKDSAFWKDVEDRKRRAQQRRASRPARTANARAAEAAAAAPEPSEKSTVAAHEEARRPRLRHRGRHSLASEDADDA